MRPLYFGKRTYYKKCAICTKDEGRAQYNKITKRFYCFSEYCQKIKFEHIKLLNNAKRISQNKRADVKGL